MAKLGFVNHAIRSPIVAGSVTGGGESIDNLQSRIGADRWVTVLGEGDTGTWLEIDSGASDTVWRAVAVFQTNLSLDASMVVKLGTTAGDDDVYSATASGVVAGRNCLILLMPQDYAARYLRLEITDADNPDDRIEVGFVYAGPLVEVSPGVTYGSSLGLEVSGTRTQTMGGQEYPLPNFTRFGWDVNFSHIKDDDVAAMVTPLTRYAAGGENVLFVPYSDATRMMSEAVYGRAVQTARVSVQTANFDANIWTFQISDRL